MSGVNVEIVPELSQDGFGNSFWASSVEAPVQKRHHPLPERYLDQLVPVYVVLEQIPDSLRCFGVNADPDTAEKQLDFRLSVRR